MTGEFPGNNEGEGHRLSANKTKLFLRAMNFSDRCVWYMDCFSTSHENATFDSYGSGVVFLTAWASAPKRKSLHDSAGMCRAKSLMLFSTGFGFWGLARTSPQFFCA